MRSAKVMAMETRFEKRENAPRSKQLLSIVVHHGQNRSYRKCSDPYVSYSNISYVAVR
jgi:hypothetical protein